MCFILSFLFFFLLLSWLFRAFLSVILRCWINTGTQKYLNMLGVGVKRLKTGVLWPLKPKIVCVSKNLAYFWNICQVINTRLDKSIPTLLAKLVFVPYLEEVDVVVGVRKPLQLCIGPPELDYLPLYLLQQLQGLTDSCSLLDSYQLLHLTALFLHGSDQLGENPLTLLHCCFCGVLWRVKFSPFGLQESCTPHCVSVDCTVNNIFKALMLKKCAHLDVSDNISQFLLRVLQFLHRLQRGFLEFFLREYKRWISHSAVPQAAETNISSTVDFQDGKFWFYNQKDWIASEGLWSIKLNFWHNIRAQDMAARPGHILHSLYSIFEMSKPLDQAVKDISFILDTTYTNLACLLSQSAVGAVTRSSWRKLRNFKTISEALKTLNIPSW